MIDCRSLLEEIRFPSTLKQIKQYAFAETYDVFPYLQNLNLDNLNELTSIDDYAFYNAISTLDGNALHLPSSLLSIGIAAFAYRRDAYTQVLSNLLQAIDLMGAQHLRYIGPSAFMYNHFKSIAFSKDLQTIDDYAFAYPKYKIDMHILSSIKSIGKNAFKDNIILNPDNTKANIICIDVPLSNLSSVLNVSVDLNDYSAENYQGFTDGTIVSAIWLSNDPYNSFAIVHNNRLNFCPSNLSIDLIDKTLIYVNDDSNDAYVPGYLTAISPSAFINCYQLTSVSAMNSISIGDHAFMNCSSLINIYPIDNDINDTYSLSNVEAYSFYNCQNLQNIQLLSTTEYVQSAAFYNCSSIQNFYSDEELQNKAYFSLSSIGPSAFYGCKSLTSFNIGPNIIQIGQNAFDNCDILSYIEFQIDHLTFLDMSRKWLSNPNIDIETAISSMFNGIREDSQCYINFTDISYTNNGIVKIDNEFVNTYIYDDSKTAISSVKDEFYESRQNFLNLSAIDRIDSFAFKNIDKLHSISFLPNSTTNNGLEDIGDYVFYGCRNLMNVNASRLSCRNIGCYAFGDCPRLLQMNIDFISLSSIGFGAFYGTSLNTLYVINCPSTDPNSENSQTLTQTVDQFKQKIGYDQTTNPNPLQLPDNCNIVFTCNDYSQIIEIGRYDRLFNDLTHATIDTNRNSIVFVDKNKDSIRPLLLVKQSDVNHLPAIVDNTFHANIIGKWK